MGSLTDGFVYVEPGTAHGKDEYGDCEQVGDPRFEERGQHEEKDQQDDETDHGREYIEYPCIHAYLYFVLHDIIIFSLGSHGAERPVKDRYIAPQRAWDNDEHTG